MELNYRSFNIKNWGFVKNNIPLNFKIIKKLMIKLNSSGI